MTIPYSAFLLIVVLLIAAVVAMGAFIWAVRKRQFADLNKAAYVIFDDDEPVGVFTDEVFVESQDEKRTGAKR
jgi:cbb3-type cytochrome oxidase maturation protein